MDFIKTYFTEYSGTIAVAAIFLLIAFCIKKYDVLGFVCNGSRFVSGTHPPKETQVKDSFGLKQNHGIQQNDETTIDNEINALPNATLQYVGNVTTSSLISRGNKMKIKTRVNSKPKKT